MSNDDRCHRCDRPQAECDRRAAALAFDRISRRHPPVRVGSSVTKEYDDALTRLARAEDACKAVDWRAEAIAARSRPAVAALRDLRYRMARDADLASKSYVGDLDDALAAWSTLGLLHERGMEREIERLRHELAGAEGARKGNLALAERSGALADRLLSERGDYVPTDADGAEAVKRLGIDVPKWAAEVKARCDAAAHAPAIAAWDVVRADGGKVSRWTSPVDAVDYMREVEADRIEPVLGVREAFTPSCEWPAELVMPRGDSLTLVDSSGDTLYVENTGEGDEREVYAEVRYKAPAFPADRYSTNVGLPAAEARRLHEWLGRWLAGPEVKP